MPKLCQETLYFLRKKLIDCEMEICYTVRLKVGITTKLAWDRIVFETAKKFCFIKLC